MIVQCTKCKKFFEDMFRSTICPHDTFPANDGTNHFYHHPEAYLSELDPEKDLSPEGFRKKRDPE